jgi:hypothetical protein
MTSPARRLARIQARVEIDFKNSAQLTAHITSLMAPFRTTFDKVEMAVIIAAIRKMVHDDANGIMARGEVATGDVPTTPVRDIDEAKSRAGWYIDHWVMTRVAELKKLKIEVDGEGKANIGVELDPDESTEKSVIIGGKSVKMGKVGVTALKPANPWEDK